MISVLYQHRALMITWLVVTAHKGHLPDALYCALLEQLAQHVPADVTVTIMGNGEFDGTEWQAAITACGWQYVCRTACDILLHVAGATIAKRGEVVVVAQTCMTAAQYGPVNALAVWDAAYEHPIYLVTTHVDVAYALALYRRRAQIETYFSDQKSRVIRINRSQLRDPRRLARLLIATALAYRWGVYLGLVAKWDAVHGRIHRPDRFDLSLFSLGLRLLACCLRHQHAIPRGLPKSLFMTPQTALMCSVRWSNLNKVY
jgi:Transposase DDE domain